MSDTARFTRLALVAACLLFSTAAIASDAESLFGRELSLIGLRPLNGFLFMIPPLAWNMALARKLDEDSFPGKAPKWYEGIEWTFRIGSMLYPVLLPIDTESSAFAPGLILYSAGLALYCASWIPFLMRPVPLWARTPIIEFAPAYLPILWLCGISMMTGSWAHGGVSAIFITLHVGEKAMIYKRS